MACVVTEPVAGKYLLRVKFAAPLPVEPSQAADIRGWLRSRHNYLDLRYRRRQAGGMHLRGTSDVFRSLLLPTQSAAFTPLIGLEAFFLDGIVSHGLALAAPQRSDSQTGPGQLPSSIGQTCIVGAPCRAAIAIASCHDGNGHLSRGQSALRPPAPVAAVPMRHCARCSNGWDRQARCQ